MSLMVAVIISGDDMDAFILFKKGFVFVLFCLLQVLHQWIAYNGTETLRPQLKHASPPADQEEGKEMSLIGCRGINIAYSKFSSASSR